MSNYRTQKLLVCEICGKVAERTCNHQYLCKECREDKKKEEKAKSTYKGKPKPETPALYGKKTEYDIAALAGKSLSTVAAEAAERGMTYGQYTVAVRAGRLPPKKNKK